MREYPAAPPGTPTMYLGPQWRVLANRPTSPLARPFSSLGSLKVTLLLEEVHWGTKDACPWVTMRVTLTIGSSMISGPTFRVSSGPTSRVSSGPTPTLALGMSL